MRLVAFDVGVKNLALVEVVLDPESLDIQSVDSVAKYNLYDRAVCDKKVCNVCRPKGLHSLLAAPALDGLAHVLKENDARISAADAVVIERQPPCGLVAIEAVLYTRFIAKAVLMMPQKMHRFLGINKLGYEERKQKTTEEAERLLEARGTQQAKVAFSCMARKHDVADALCIAACYADCIKKAQKKRQVPNVFSKFAFCKNA